jgi:hypothetical protein
MLGRVAALLLGLDVGPADIDFLSGQGVAIDADRSRAEETSAIYRHAQAAKRQIAC